MPAQVRFYNTLTRQVEAFRPQIPGKVGIYVCGMTVYDHTHVGHARAMVVFDTLVRFLRYRGFDVTFVRNFTDVDDKLIQRAAERQMDTLELARHFIDAFREDMAALGLRSPDLEPKVSESMDCILDMIADLVAKEHAYVQDGNVWFAVESCADYGKLSHQKPDALRNADEGRGKRSPADFALWKAAKPGEPAWESPWGAGRPGWHIECSAMSRAHLGATIDIHGGGLDLVFPHHENEIAQSECCNGVPYARYWLHNGLLTMTGGQKMGKSLGNVINVRDALAQFPAEALRLYYLQNHYRSPLPWSNEALPDALRMLARLYDAREAAEAMSGDGPADRVAAELGQEAQGVLAITDHFDEKFLAAVDNDFNTPQALGMIFELARAVNRLARHQKAKKRGGPIAAEALRAFALVSDALGLLGGDVLSFQDEVKAKRLTAMGLDRDDIEGLLREREAARTAKDWSRSDAIRDELLAQSILVMDTPEGVSWRVRLHDAESL